ncbi:hypothetical protein [Mycobacterium haemophilum]|uniref:Uncharacterized protein n=1 Tax=Mycobacterium haemophilum TaxID=29311 RepID=A0A0I9U299_9MYCO|nr:hypothetical protein [Mycobacterium haemophilum]KLO27024.1 hypothetical protein ABH39_16640 [Mycobacterium haemophilum]KLO34955.1 hypothetical protein ABH38_17365 [Mycobacterium haemophilum]KLO40932.1 hypothetical protein ABH37_14940 [Mycobacterium haemophilum]KLO47256.1 hypothetical protein ABH36_17295 [Mycobacterium haemophilum]
MDIAIELTRSHPQRVPNYRARAHPNTMGLASFNPTYSASVTGSGIPDGGHSYHDHAAEPFQPSGA